MAVKELLLILIFFVGFVNVQKHNNSPNDKTIKPISDADNNLHSVNLRRTETLRMNKRMKNENMELKKKTALMKKETKASDSEGEMATLKALLKETMRTNKRLKKQNRRQQQVWFALEQMCNALGHAPTKEKQHNSTMPEKTDMKSTKPPKIDASAFHIQPLFINAKVLDPSGRSNITIAFTSERKPTVEWLFLKETEQMYRTAGWSFYKKDNHTYMAGVTIVPELLRSHMLFFRVYDTKDLFVMRVNLSAVHSSGHQTILSSHLQLDLHEYARNESTNDVKAIFAIKGNVSLISEVECYLSGLNISSSPPEMFELSSFSHMNVTSNDISGSEKRTVVDIDNIYSQYGGMLSVLLKIPPDSPGLYSHLQFGKQFPILSLDKQTVIAPGSIGLFQIPSRTVLYPPYQSIICGAMGNPRPYITLEKHNVKNMLSEELTEDVIIDMDEFTTMKAYTIEANSSNVEGKYTCRAWRGNNVATVTTEVFIYQEARVDKLASGLMRNSSNKIEIACQASGVPIPHLHLNLFDEYGPDIARSSRYKASKSNLDDRTTLLEVTMSPVDVDIFKVYCYALQRCSLCEPDTLPIQIFPDPDEINWTLYDEFARNQTLL